MDASAIDDGSRTSKNISGCKPLANLFHFPNQSHFKFWLVVLGALCNLVMIGKLFAHISPYARLTGTNEISLQFQMCRANIFVHCARGLLSDLKPFSFVIHSSMDVLQIFRIYWKFSTDPCKFICSAFRLHCRCNCMVFAQRFVIRHILLHFILWFKMHTPMLIESNTCTDFSTDFHWRRLMNKNSMEFISHASMKLVES